MKIYTIFLISIFLISCNNDVEKSTLTTDLNEIYQYLDLKNPDVVLNEIALGEMLPFKISNILSENNVNVPPNRYYFEYIPNSNKILKLTTYNNNQCREESSTLFYNNSNFISRVETVTIDFCSQNEFTTIYNYNYSNGILKSVISNNTSFLYEKYFSYYPNGKISIIYSVGRPKSDTTPYRTFTKSYLTYDSNGNVKTLDGDHNDPYNIKTTFEYDNKCNPVKGLFVNNNFMSPIERIGILSTNNIISSSKEYTNNPNDIPIIDNFQFNYLNDKVISYSSTNNNVNVTYYINYE